MKWFIVTGVLCVYGFFKEFRPVEPFLTPYLQSPLKNFTDEQLYSQVYPFATYSYLIFLVPTFILTDLLRYKPVIIFEGLTYAATWILLIWGYTVGHMQWMQIFYGFATGTEVAYFAYIFAAVDSKHYRKATSYVKAAIALGDFFAYGLSQLLIYIYGPDYQLLNYISLASCILIIPLAACLPWISCKMSLKKIDNESNAASNENTGGNQFIQEANADGQTEYNCLTGAKFLKQYFVCLWLNFKNIYSTTFMWKWSLWWALATCGFFQIGGYIQTLWAKIQPNDQEALNGLVEAVNTLLSCIVILCMQFIDVRWQIWGELTLAITSAIDCVLLIIMSQANLIGVVFAFYIIFTLIYQMMFTIGMYNIAKGLTTESYGLVFGFNTFIALILQTALTFAVNDAHGFDLEIRSQFVVYGCYHGVIAIIFAVMAVYTLVKHYRLSVLVVAVPTS